MIPTSRSSLDATGRRWWGRSLLSLALGAMLAACGGDAISTPTTTTLVGGSWSSRWPQLRHDGQPFSSENFIVYSEQSSMAAREDVAEIAETVFEKLTVQLDVDRGDFDFLPTYQEAKIHIMADYNQMAQSGLAYRDGVIIRATDSPRYVSAGHTPASYQRLMHHEVMHVVEFLLIGNPSYSHASDVWLREGFANYVGRPNTLPVTSTADLEAWQEEMGHLPGGGNPIGIHVWTDFPSEVLAANTTIRYYRFFELATHYLLDPNGLGRTIEDLKAVYEDLGAGRPFAQAFEEHFELDLAVFRQEYFSRMTDYLTASEGQ